MMTPRNPLLHAACWHAVLLNGVYVLSSSGLVDGIPTEMSEMAMLQQLARSIAQLLHY